MSHEKGIEAAADKMIENIEADESVSAADNVYSIIKTYLSASNQVLVPREPTEEMLFAAWDRAPVDMSNMDDGYYAASYQDMISAYPNPFKDK